MTVSDEENERSRKRLLVLALAALFLVGAGAGVSVWMRAPQTDPGGDPFPTPKTAMPRLPDTQNTELESELSFSRLMEILGMESQKPSVAPVARTIVKAFTTQPELKRKYDEFKRKADLGHKPTAKDFMASMRSQPAFGRMAAELGRSAGGSAAMMSLAQHPELRRFLGEQDRLMKAGGDPAARDKKAIVPGGLAGAKPAEGGAGAGSALKAGGAAPNTTELAQLASAGPAISASGGTGTQGAAGGSGSDAHDATKLDKGWKDEKNITLSDDVKKLNKLLQQYPCLASLGQPKLLRFINGADIDKLGLWGACFQLKWFADCRATGCTPPVGEHPCWSACLEANSDNERTCIQKVRLQPGCSQADIPGDIWAVNCVPKRVNGKCVSRTPPIAECGLSPCVDDAAAVAPATAGPVLGGPNCPALTSGKTLPMEAESVYESAANAKWDSDEELRNRFMSGAYVHGRGTTSQVDFEDARKRYLLEYTRDRKTEGWRDCSVDDGGYGGKDWSRED